MIYELYFNDAIFSVHRKLLDIGFFLALLDVHVDHFMLKGLFHTLDDDFLALTHLLLDTFLHYVLKYNQYPLIPLIVV